METFPISGKIAEESWHTSPVLSESCDVSSIHIHTTFSTILLMGALSASTLSFVPSLCSSPQQDWLSSACPTHLLGKMVLWGEDIADIAGREGTSPSLCSAGASKEKVTVRDSNTFSTDSFFLLGCLWIVEMSFPRTHGSCVKGPVKLPETS